LQHKKKWWLAWAGTVAALYARRACACLRDDDGYDDGQARVAQTIHHWQWQASHNEVLSRGPVSSSFSAFFHKIGPVPRDPKFQFQFLLPLSLGFFL